MSELPSTRYVFGRASDGEWLAGWQWQQLPAAALGVAGAAVALRSLPSDGGFIAAVASVVAGLAVAALPIAGHRIDQWVPLAAGWLNDRVRRRHRWRSATPVLGHTEGFVRIDPPPPLAGVEILSVAAGDDEIGVAADHSAGVYSAALRLRPDGLLLQADAAQDQRLAAWGAVLAAAARGGSPIHRVQWVQRSTPDDGALLDRWFADRREDGAAAASYAALLDAATPLLRRHENLIAVSVSTDRSGFVRGDRATRTDRMLALLAREVRTVADRLVAGGFDVDGVMTPEGLVTTLRRGFDPFSPAPLMGHQAGLPIAWPVACETSTRSYRCDAVWHATYWVEQWPRLPVRGTFLAPLILDGPAVRSVSVLAEPVSAARAVQRVERDLVSATVNDHLRARWGFRTSARRRQQTDTTARREADLAAGHEEYRCVALLTVSGRSEAELTTACTELKQLAQQAHLGIRRLWGRQAEGFAAAQPLALDLR